MKNLHIIFLLLFLGYEYSHAQLTITPQSQFTANAILQSNFITSGAGTVTNVIVGSGFPGRFATFTGTSNLGINNGIVLSTGNTINIPNAASMQYDDANTCGSNYPMQCPDAQLQALIPTFAINDVTTLSFDFQPATDTIRFQYVFASEEYPEYVCAFNDVFGFFVTGSTPTGGTFNNANVALIPGTTLPVSVNSINPGVSGGGGTCTGPGQSLAYSNLYVNNSGTTIIFDGLTTVLDVTIPVVVLDTYHIKMGICNALDGIFESAVFLRDNTFGGLAPRIAIPSSPGITVSNDTVYACIGATATFTSPKSINYNWSTGQITQSISLAAPATPQTISCFLTNNVVPAFYPMTPLHYVTDNSCTVGLTELNADAGITLNFHSGNNELTLNSKHDLPPGTHIKIYNLSGSNILDFKTGTNSNAINIPLNISSGIYIVHVFNNNINLAKRFEKL